MLFIDDDQPEILHRGKHRRAGADDDPSLARSQREPAIEPFAFTQMTVPDHALITGRNRLQARAQSRHGLGRQSHFGH